MTTIQARAQRLVDEFEEGASFLGAGRFSIGHGIARVLRNLSDTEAGYADEESWYAIPAHTLESLADTLEAPTLLDRALAGDATAARQFLREAGFTDERGQWLPQYQTQEDSTND
jgi:hypothetical protein